MIDNTSIWTSCTTCDALPGEACRSTRGRPLREGRLHATRLQPIQGPDKMNFSKRKADVSIIRERYQNKEKRDARAKDLVEVYGAHVVKRSSQRSVVLHPEYVRDWEGEVRSGFGNDQYKTFFPAIYTVEADI